MAADMHVEGRRIGAQQMIMDGRDIETVLDHLRHDGLDLGFQQHEIAHRHHFAAHGLERHPAAERERGFDGDAIERHGEVGARKTIAMNVTGNDRGLSAECIVDLLPIDVLRASGGRRRQQRNSNQRN